jgi:hypothetical protein
MTKYSCSPARGVVSQGDLASRAEVRGVAASDRRRMDTLATPVGEGRGLVETRGPEAEVDEVVTVPSQSRSPSPSPSVMSSTAISGVGGASFVPPMAATWQQGSAWVAPFPASVPAAMSGQSVGTTSMKARSEPWFEGAGELAEVPKEDDRGCGTNEAFQSVLLVTEASARGAIESGKPRKALIRALMAETVQIERAKFETMVALRSRTAKGRLGLNRALVPAVVPRIVFAAVEIVGICMLVGCPWGFEQSDPALCSNDLSFPFDEGLDLKEQGGTYCFGSGGYFEGAARCIHSFQISVTAYCEDGSCLASELPFSDTCNDIIRGRYCEGAELLGVEDVALIRSCVEQYVELALGSDVTCDSEFQFCEIFERIEECISARGPQGMAGGDCFDVFTYIENGGFVSEDCPWWSSYECFEPYVGICDGTVC